MQEQFIIDSRYKSLYRLSSGGFANFYLGVDMHFGGTRVGIKEILPKFAKRSQTARMFEREANITVRLRHPNIVAVRDARKTADGRYFIIMDYIDGVDLRRLLKKCRSENHKLPQELAAFVMAEACEALHKAHTFSEDGENFAIVHKDVSPANIMLDFDGHVRVIDFGIAQARLKNGQPEWNLSAGKIHYMSPEQLQQERVDHRSDIFSAGVVLFEALTTEKLFIGKDANEIIDLVTHAEIDFSRFERHKLTSAAGNVILHAVQRRPEDRYASAKQMHRDLSQLLLAAGKMNFQLKEELSQYLRRMFPEHETSAIFEHQGAGDDDHTKFIETVSIKEYQRRRAEASAQTGVRNARDTNGFDPDKTVVVVTTPDLTSEPELAAVMEDDEDSDKTIIWQDPYRQAKAAPSQARPVSFKQSPAFLDDDQTILAEEQEEIVGERNSHVAHTDGAPHRMKTGSSNGAAFPSTEEIDDGNTVLIDAPEAEANYRSSAKPTAPDDEETFAFPEAFSQRVKEKKRHSKKWPLAAGISMVVFALSALAAWKILSLKPTLEIATIPAGAQIFIDGQAYPGRTPITEIMSLNGGEHTVRLELAGFEPVEEKIALSKGQRFTIARSFQAKFIITTGINGAAVFINGDRQEQLTPLAIHRPVDQPFQLEVRFPDGKVQAGFTFQRFDQPPSMENPRLWRYNAVGNPAHTFEISAGNFKKVMLRSFPPQAEIYLDEAATPAGLTDRDSVLFDGQRHKVTLKKAGFLSREYLLNGDEDFKNQRWRLDKIVGIHTYEAADPAKTEIHADVHFIVDQISYQAVDIRYAGKNMVLPCFRHGIMIRKPGYLDKMVILGELERNLSVAMEKQPLGFLIELIDSETSERIRAGEIWIKNVNKDRGFQWLGKTNSYGSFSVPLLPPGDYLFKADGIGYDTRIFPEDGYFSITSAKPDTLLIPLQRAL